MIKFSIQVTRFDSSKQATHSAAMVDGAIKVCLGVLYETTPLANMNMLLYV